MGADRDSQTERLLGATAVVVGCGSVGAPVACALAQAGAGRIVLVDPEVLSWANVGTHPLGAADEGEQGRSLVRAAADRLSQLTVEHRACSLHHLISHEAELLAGADLIIATTGNWVAESALTAGMSGKGALSRFFTVGPKRKPAPATRSRSVRKTGAYNAISAAPARRT